MAMYLEWLAVRMIERGIRGAAGSTLAEIKEMTIALKLRRPKTGSRSRISARSGLPNKARQRLLQVIPSGSVDNPFDECVQGRNEIIVRLLDETGIRAGELLALKVSDFDFQRNEVVVARRHGDPRDPRSKQPVVKTLDRRIPLSASLCQLISDYVLHDRRDLPRAKRHEFLLVVHKAGPHLGLPLTEKGLSKVFLALKNADPELLKELCTHVMRHTNNERFSNLMDSTGATTAQEEQMRSYLMGWREGSGTSSVYTRRHVQRKADEAFRKLQSRDRKGAT